MKGKYCLVRLNRALNKDSTREKRQSLKTISMPTDKTDYCLLLSYAIMRSLKVISLLLQVIRAVTASPASALGLSSSLGSLAVGREADVTVFKLDEDGVEEEVVDTKGRSRTLRKRIKPVVVVRAGKIYECY